MPYFVLILALLQPILSFPLAIFNSVKKSTSPINNFAISLALAAITFALIPPPELDLFVHYKRIDSLKGLPLETVIQHSASGYKVFDIYAWLINYINLPRETLSATVVFASYYLILSIFARIKKLYLYDSKNIIRILGLFIFLLCIDYVSLASGLRNHFANIIVFYASFILFQHKRIYLYILLVLIAFFVHPASLLPSLIVSVAFLFPKLSKYSKPIVVISVFIMLGNKGISPVIDYLNSLASNLSFWNSNSGYIDQNSTWGGGFSEVASTKGWLAAFVIYRLPTYLSIFYLLKLKPVKGDLLYLSICLSILLLSIFFSFHTLFLRYNSFYIYLFSLFFIIQYSKKPNKYNFYFGIFYVTSLLLINLTNLYSFRNFVLSSSQAFYKPLLFLVTGI